MLTFAYEGFRAEVTRLHPRYGPRGRALWTGTIVWLVLFAALAWVCTGANLSLFQRGDPVLVRSAVFLPFCGLMLLGAYRLGAWVRAKPPAELEPYAKARGGYDEWLRAYLRTRVLEQFGSAQEALRILPIVLHSERRFLRRLRPHAWEMTALATLILGGLGYMWREVYVRLPLKAMTLSATTVTLAMGLLGTLAPVWKELWFLEWRRRTAYSDVMSDALLEARFRTLRDSGTGGAAPRAA